MWGENEGVMCLQRCCCSKGPKVVVVAKLAAKASDGNANELMTTMQLRSVTNGSVKRTESGSVYEQWARDFRAPTHEVVL